MYFLRLLRLCEPQRSRNRRDILEKKPHISRNRRDLLEKSRKKVATAIPYKNKAAKKSQPQFNSIQFNSKYVNPSISKKSLMVTRPNKQVKEPADILYPQ